MQAADAVDLDTGMTAFHIACDANQPECAEELARVGCDVGVKGNDGETGREIAERRGHAAVVARLRAAAGEQLPAAPGSTNDHVLQAQVAAALVKFLM